MSRSLSLFHTSLHKVQLLHQNLSLFHRLFRYLHLLDVFTNVTRRHYNTSCTTGFKGFSICLYSSAKSSYLWTNFGWFFLSNGRSTPQLSAPPFDHDVPIALCKGKKSCIDHSISYLFLMIVLNFLFVSLPFPCLLYLYPGHMRRIHWYRLEAGHEWGDWCFCFSENLGVSISIHTCCRLSLGLHFKVLPRWFGKSV